MDHNKRHKRLRQLLSRLNKERKVQAQKVDILCNDLIAAQRTFIKNLSTINFAANFYETIIGTTELSNLLYTAGKLIKDEIPDANVAFFLRQQDGFQLHLLDNDQPTTLGQERLENCFTRELVENICNSNKICTPDNLLAMGLQSNPNQLNTVSLVTIPLGRMGPSPGFILIYRPSENELTNPELTNVAAIAPGLSKAVVSCQTAAHPAV